MPLSSGSSSPTRGVDVDVRVVQRVLAPHRQAKHATEVATVFVAVLGYSRHCVVQPFRRQRHDDWREGLAGAFRHFGGVTQTVLVDNARALIADRGGDVVQVRPGFKAFCDDWGVQVRACKAYRARTKGKTERGVGYVKHNALAGRTFEPSYLDFLDGVLRDELDAKQK